MKDLFVKSLIEELGELFILILGPGVSVDLGLLFDELVPEQGNKASIDFVVTFFDDFCELDFVANELEHVLKCLEISASII